MYCRKCGTWCEDQAVFCSQCGESLAGNDKQNPGTMYNTNNSYGTNSYNMNYQGGYGIMVTYAGFWKRVLAIIIDGLILGIVEGIINWIFTSVGLETVGSILSIIIAWLYYSLMESSEYQATLGKMALHLRVTDVTWKVRGHRDRDFRLSGYVPVQSHGSPALFFPKSPLPLYRIYVR